MSDAAARWKAFLGKVRTRLTEIVDEATAGLEEIISVEVIDPGPISAAQNEVKARLFALREKIDASWSKLEPDFGDTNTLPFEAQGRALGDEILKTIERLEADTQKKYRARLRELALQELAERKLTCARCHAPLAEPDVKHRPENVTCTHCQAVNTVYPGPAMGMYGPLSKA